MSELRYHRRDVLAGLVSTGGLTAGGGLAPALAAAPALGFQAPAWYRYKIGDIEVTVVSDGANRFRFADTHVMNRTRAEVNTALKDAFYEADIMTTPYNPVVINTGPKLVVVDPGTGEAQYQRTRGDVGRFLINLVAAGISPRAIDIVLLSHFHSDHIGGLISPDGASVFPNAEVMVPEREWAYFMDDGEMSRAPAGRMQDVFRNVRRIFDAIGRRVTPYAPGKEISPGLTSVATPGHTPGHNSFIVASGTSRLYVQADVTHVPFLFARNPGWHVYYDQDAAMAEATRRKVYDMLIAERMPVQGFHFPFPSLAWIERSQNGYREVPVNWQHVL